MKLFSSDYYFPASMNWKLIFELVYGFIGIYFLMIDYYHKYKNVYVYVFFVQFQSFERSQGFTREFSVFHYQCSFWTIFRVLWYTTCCWSVLCLYCIHHVPSCHGVGASEIRNLLYYWLCLNRCFILCTQRP